MIEQGYAGKWFKLVNAKTGKEVDLPATLHDFHGEKAKLVDARPPHKPESEGFVCHRHLGGRNYVSVYGLKWKPIAVTLVADKKCRSCRGTGTVYDWVDYGSTRVQMPSTCDCVVAHEKKGRSKR